MADQSVAGGRVSEVPAGTVPEELLKASGQARLLGECPVLVEGDICVKG